MLVIQSPLYEVSLDDGQMLPMSPVQTAALSLIGFNPDLKPVAQAILVPGTFYRVFVQEVANCWSGARCEAKVGFRCTLYI